jgi:hypothetical protein
MSSGEHALRRTTIPLWKRILQRHRATRAMLRPRAPLVLFRMAVPRHRTAAPRDGRPHESRYQFAIHVHVPSIVLSGRPAPARGPRRSRSIVRTIVGHAGGAPLSHIARLAPHPALSPTSGRGEKARTPRLRGEGRHPDATHSPQTIGAALTRAPLARAALTRIPEHRSVQVHAPANEMPRRRGQEPAPPLASHPQPIAHGSHAALRTALSTRMPSSRTVEHGGARATAAAEVRGRSPVRAGVSEPTWRAASGRVMRRGVALPDFATALQRRHLPNAPASPLASLPFASPRALAHTPHPSPLPASGARGTHTLAPARGEGRVRGKSLASAARRGPEQSAPHPSHHSSRQRSSGAHRRAVARIVAAPSEHPSPAVTLAARAHLYATPASRSLAHQSAAPAEPPRVPDPRPAPGAADREQAPQPPLDIARLSDDVYRHIQKKIRIDRERRGL